MVGVIACSGYFSVRCSAGMVSARISQSQPTPIQMMEQKALVLPSTTTIHFYRFVPVSTETITTFRSIWMTLARKYSIKGTFRISSEGVNCGMAGEPTAIDAVVEQLARLWPIHFGAHFWKGADGNQLPITRQDAVRGVPFRRLLYKVKKSVITFPAAVNVEITKQRYISAHGLATLFDSSATSLPSTSDTMSAALRDIDGKEIVLVDTRNDYEYKEGTFRSAITLPHVKYFRDVATKQTVDLLEPFRDKRLVTFCTGGVRCEKAVPWLVQNGFDAVALKGGILGYLGHIDEATTANTPSSSPANHSSVKEGAATTDVIGSSTAETIPSSRDAWRGECLVFDLRHTELSSSSSKSS